MMAKRKRKYTKPPKPKRGPGRPTKKSQEIVDILLKCLTMGLHIETACGYAKIERTTFYRWLESDKNFATQVDFARSQAVIRLAQKVENLDTAGAWKLLKNIAPKLYRDKIDHSMEAGDGGPLRIIVKDYRSKQEDEDADD